MGESISFQLVVNPFMYNVDEWSNMLYKFCGNFLIIRRNVFIFPFSNILSWKIWNNMNMKVYYQVSICFFKLSNNNNRKKSSLIYNMSARHERHECDTSATRGRHECYTNDTSATRMKSFDFDKDTGKNIFSHP